MNWNWDIRGELRCLTIPEWLDQGIDIGFSVRDGGVSEAPYASLNLGLHVGDQTADVLENRRRWLAAWNVSGSGTVVAEQVHGAEVVWVQEDDGGRGVFDLETVIPGVDGFVTKSSIGLMTFYADCVPLFFYYPDLKAVGIAHAGWRGTQKAIARKMIECFEEAGGNTAMAWAAIGPSIGSCCYKVDEPVAEQFRSAFGEAPYLQSLGAGQYQLNLWEANRTLLLQKGVRPENIALAGLCTKDHPEWFFSHRRDGARTGRMAGWIRIRS